MAGSARQPQEPQHRPVEGARAGPDRRAAAEDDGARDREQLIESGADARARRAAALFNLANPTQRRRVCQAVHPRPRQAGRRVPRRAHVDRPQDVRARRHARPAAARTGCARARPCPPRATTGPPCARQRAQVPHPAHERHAQAGRLPALWLLRLAADGCAADLVRFYSLKPRSRSTQTRTANRVLLAGGSTLCASARTRPWSSSRSGWPTGGTGRTPSATRSTSRSRSTASATCPTQFMLDNNMSQWSPGWNLTSSDPNSGLFLYDNGMPVAADHAHTLNTLHTLRTLPLCMRRSTSRRSSSPSSPPRPSSTSGRSSRAPTSVLSAHARTEHAHAHARSSHCPLLCVRRWFWYWRAGSWTTALRTGAGPRCTHANHPQTATPLDGTPLS